MRILYTSADLHTAIKRTLGSPGAGERRVVLVAYIGARAEAFLPHPDKLTIVCALQPGATNAEALVRLQERGARILQSDGLHMKVYWSNRKGAVICSANASLAALGRSGLKEAGAWFPPGKVNIDTLLAYAKPRRITPRELRKLARLSDRLEASIPNQMARSGTERVSLQAWLESDSRKPWKLGWWDRKGGVAKSARAEAIAHYGVRDPAQYLGCRKGELAANDWVLMFDGDTGRSASWMYTDFVIRVHRRDREYSHEYPYHAVQVHRGGHYPSPPFSLDAGAREIIAKAIQAFGVEQIKERKNAHFPPRLVSLLRKYGIGQTGRAGRA